MTKLTISQFFLKCSSPKLSCLEANNPRQAQGEPNFLSPQNKQVNRE